MAYADQVRHREKAMSGAASFVIVAVMGYAFASGMAVNVLKDVAPPFLVHNWLSDTPPPPPPMPSPPHRTAKSTIPVRNPVPTPRPQEPTPLDMSTTTLPMQPGPQIADVHLPPLLPVDPGPQPSVDHTSSAAPRGDPSSWVTVDDYPSSAIRDGRHGRTRFRVSVSSDGRPSDCSIVSGSGSDDLDQTACREVLRRARFTPATDASGAKVASSYSGSVLWQLPGE